MSSAASQPDDDVTSWRDLKKLIANEKGKPKRFTLTTSQKKVSKKLDDHLPRLQKSLAKVTAVSGCEAMAVVTDRQAKRPGGKKSGKPKHTTATFRAVLTGAHATSGVSGAQAKQVLTGQLQSMLDELKKPSTTVKFVQPPKPRKAAAADAAPADQDALMDSYSSLLVAEA